MPGLLREEAVDAVARDHDRGVEITVGTVGRDARDPSPLVAQQAGGGGRTHEEHPIGLGLRCEPVVPVGTVRGRAVVGRMAPCRAAVVDRERLGVGQHHGRAASDPTLDRRLLPPLRMELIEDARVDDAAVHVLRARERAAFEQDHRVTLAGEHRGRRRTGRAGPDDDDVEGRRRSRQTSRSVPNRRFSSASVSLASLTTARSAIAIIGQCGSVLTLMMWSGWPSPLVCCTAPLTPNDT